MVPVIRMLGVGAGSPWEPAKETWIAFLGWDVETSRPFCPLNFEESGWWGSLGWVTWHSTVDFSPDVSLSALCYPVLFARLASHVTRASLEFCNTLGSYWLLILLDGEVNQEHYICFKGSWMHLSVHLRYISLCSTQLRGSGCWRPYLNNKMDCKEWVSVVGICKSREFGGLDSN